MDAELIAYLDRRFEQVDRRFEQVDQRFLELHILIEAMDHKVGLVAEGVLANHQAIEVLRVDMSRELEEVKAVNRLSHAELDRR